MPKIARVACVVAFVMAGITILSALTRQVVLLPFALIPLMAGIGILRRRAWGAYGFSLYLLAQLLLVPLVVLRNGSFESLSRDTAATVVVPVVLIPLYFFAGRALARTDAERGWAWPWIAVSILFAAPLLFVQAFLIPTGTMEDTLLIGDRILVRRLPQPTLARGDMIAFIYPVDRSQSFVKRIVGIPGDRIKIAGKVVYRNGVEVKEPYAVHKTGYMDSYRDNFPSEPNIKVERGAVEMLQNNVTAGEVVVPDGRYFVLGDNRDNSWDSRYWGFISPGDVIGKPLLIYDSEEQATGARRIRWERLFKVL